MKRIEIVWSEGSRTVDSIAYMAAVGNARLTVIGQGRAWRGSVHEVGKNGGQSEHQFSKFYTSPKRAMNWAETTYLAGSGKKVAS